jgi:predicted phage baseplate assembly protein
MTCTDERRREDARARHFNGVDSVDVSDDGRTLTVIFFGKAPEDLEPANFRVDGGRRVTGIEVTGVEPCVDEDPELEDRVRLTVDRTGDLSEYRLCVVEAGPCGEPGTTPLPGFDPRYACAEFTFHPGCAELDCKPVDDCPPRTPAEPEIDYLAKDYASFRQLLLDRLRLTMPAWTERHVPDIGVALVELLAYEGDRLSYRQDAVATEAYLDTARQRVSIRRHARLVDYAVHDGCAARSWVCLETTEEITLPPGDFRFVTLPAGVLSDRGPALLQSDLGGRGVPTHEVFEPVHRDAVVLRPAHNEIHLWTWGNRECHLPAGTTSATLVDSEPDCGEDKARVLRLAPGDVLVFEELLGPKTGNPADADHSHRQAVRLTSVTEAVDELYRQPVLEVTWAREDALTFPLCVTARGGRDCVDLEVGVARGNVVLTEHGRGIAWCDGDPEDIPVPEPVEGEPGCPDPVDFGCPDPTATSGRPPYPPLPIRFRPRLKLAPVTQSAPFPAPADVAAAQARRLLGLPGRTRERLTELWRRLGHHELSEEDRKYLTTVFGAAMLRKVGLDEHPRHALRTLLARFDELLEVKLTRLAELIRRARAGYALRSGDEGWEIGQSWGASEGAAIGEENPEFRGPAASATRPDPRTALPAVGIDDRFGRGWEPRRDLLDSGAADRHFVGEVNDDGMLVLRFGDGRSGAVFPLGDYAHARYRVGNGVAGNVGREAINRIVFCRTRQNGIRLVRNPLAAAGGTEPEPVAEVRVRAPRDVRHRLLRAVTAADYAALAGQIPGVQRAAGDLRWTGSWYEAQIAVDPLGAEVAPDWLLDQVRESMYRYRRIGHDLAVFTATLVPLDLELRVEVAPEHTTGHVRAALSRVFAGLFQPDQLTFGTPIRVSRLVAAAAAVPGVRHVEVTRLRRLFAPPDDALETGVLVIGPLEVAQFDNDPSRPENGLLALDLRGGR